MEWCGKGRSHGSLREADPGARGRSRENMRTSRRNQRGIALAWTALVLLYRRLLLSIRGYRKAAELYAVLLGWGQRSGLARLIHETPLEFGVRLDKHFPRLKTEIDVIINAFNAEVYGETIMSGEGMRGVYSAWRELRSPRHWPLRMKIRFFNSGNGEYS